MKADLKINKVNGPWYVGQGHCLLYIYCDDLVYRTCFLVLFQDVEKCIAIMEDLAILPVNLTILKKNPDIMNTIKKVQCKVID